jgi:hypothetical protein
VRQRSLLRSTKIRLSSGCHYITDCEGSNLTNPHTAQHRVARMSTKVAAALSSSLGERRFAGKLSDDYPLWRLARPSSTRCMTAFAKELRGLPKAEAVFSGHSISAGAWETAPSKFCFLWH